MSCFQINIPSNSLKKIFPRHAMKKYYLDNNELFFHSIDTKSKEYLLDSIDCNIKNMSLFYKDDMMEEILEKYKDRIIYISNNMISIQKIEDYKYFIIVSDSNNMNDIYNILNEQDIMILTRFFSGIYFSEDMNQDILFTLLGILFSYYPIDIYGFIYNMKITLNNDNVKYYNFNQYIENIFKPILIQLNEKVTPNTILSRLLNFYCFNLKPDTVLYIPKNILNYYLCYNLS